MFFMDNLSVSNAQKVKKGGKTWTFSAQMPSTRDRTVMVPAKGRKIENAGFV